MELRKEADKVKYVYNQWHRILHAHEIVYAHPHTTAARLRANAHIKEGL